MAMLKRDAASKVKARVMNGADAQGNVLSYDELKPDLEKLRTYAQTLSVVSRAKLNQQLDQRVRELNPEGAEGADAVSEAATEAPTDAPTDAPTEATEAASEATEAASEAATKAYTPRQLRDNQLEF